MRSAVQRYLFLGKLICAVAFLGSAIQAHAQSPYLYWYSSISIDPGSGPMVANGVSEAGDYGGGIDAVDYQTASS